MGCFLGCFRIKGDGSRRCQLFSKSFSWKKRELLVGKDRYASVVLSEGKGTPSEKAEGEVPEEGFDGDESSEKLRQQAKFLKTCGAILETPIEIRKALVSQSLDSSTCKNINWDQPLEAIGGSPSNAPETLASEVSSHENFQHEEIDNTRRKFVRFEELNHSVNGKNKSSKLDISPQEEYQLQPSGSESPYPTPLHLIDGLQTPGTVYPPKLENFISGRIRSQFVFAVPNLSECSSDFSVLCEDNKYNQNVSSTYLNQDAFGLVKHPSTRNETRKTVDFRKEQFHSDNSSDSDRPIIGAAAAHWSGEDPSSISPKQWDGNGIPNSTTKYKEDQKVSWHATPFEVRLEKALSNEKVYP